jgi:hypothetical protein
LDFAANFGGFASSVALASLYGIAVRTVSSIESVCHRVKLSFLSSEAMRFRRDFDMHHCRLPKEEAMIGEGRGKS